MNNPPKKPTCLRRQQPALRTSTRTTNQRHHLRQQLRGRLTTNNTETLVDKRSGIRIINGTSIFTSTSTGTSTGTITSTIKPPHHRSNNTNPTTAINLHPVPRNIRSNSSKP